MTDPVVRNLLPAHPARQRDQPPPARPASSAPAPPTWTSTSGRETSATSWAPATASTLYYVFQRDERGEPNLQGNTIPGFGDIRASHRQIGTLNHTHIFGANVVNEARFGFNRINISFAPERGRQPGQLRDQQRHQHGRGPATDHRAGSGPQLRRPQRLPPGPNGHHLRPGRHAQLPARVARAQVRGRVPELQQRQLRDQRRDLHVPEPGRLPGRARERVHRAARR